MDNTRNTIMAIALSVLVLLAWQYFFIAPAQEERRKAAEGEAQRQAQEQTSQVENDGAIPTGEGDLTAPTQTAGAELSNAEASTAASPRIEINSELLSGSINLRGAGSFLIGCCCCCCWSVVVENDNNSNC